MKNLTSRISAAIVIVLLILSVPLWLPGLQALAASNTNPVDETSTFYILDAGWTAGSTTQKVLAVPQVLAWSPGHEEVAWATETGFISGGIHDPKTGHIYITELRNKDHSSLLNVNFASDKLSAYTEEWAMYLTALDGESGEVVNRTALDLASIYARGALEPIGVSGDNLYLMDYSHSENLFAYDLDTGQLTGDAWSLCEDGYLMRAVFLRAANVPKVARNDTSSRVAALCMDYSTGSQSSITLTNLGTDEQSNLELSTLGNEDYQTGNGIFLANEMFYAIDTDAGVIVEIDMDTMKITQTSHYRDGLPQGKSSRLDDLLGWLSEQIVSPAAAKRWYALTAVSPDGRWLAVDGGFSESQGTIADLLLVDLDTLQAVRGFELSQFPEQIAFGNEDELLVVFSKVSFARGTTGVWIDIISGETQSIEVPTHGWVRGILRAD